VASLPDVCDHPHPSYCHHDNMQGHDTRIDSAAQHRAMEGVLSAAV